MMGVSSARLAALAGTAVTERRTLRGGALSTVERLTLRDGTRRIAKSAEGVGREARMLQAMAEAGVRVPAVHATQDDVVLLEDLGDRAGPARPRDWQALAETLRVLHARTGPQYGWPEDHAFGPVAITNAPSPSWVSFWAEHRLIGPAQGLPAELRGRIERLAGRLGTFLPDTPAPALLHGDLWHGNVLMLPGPDAALIDPACYFGDPRVDLVMLYLFCDPPAEFRTAVGDGAGMGPETCAVYQLWPALVHVRLFGAAYRPMLEDRLARLGH